MFADDYCLQDASRSIDHFMLENGGVDRFLDELNITSLSTNKVTSYWIKIRSIAMENFGR